MLLHRLQHRTCDGSYALDRYVGMVRGPKRVPERPNNDLRPIHSPEAEHTRTFHWSTDTLASRCWCEAMEVQVTSHDVLNGRTQSCGQADCTPEWDEQAARLRAKDIRRGRRYRRPSLQIAWEAGNPLPANIGNPTWVVGYPGGPGRPPNQRSCCDTLDTAVS